MKIFKHWLLTGLLLQLAIGPVFFFIIHLTLQRTILYGFIAVGAVTIVDYFYITLAILGVGTLLKKKKIKRTFWIVSSLVLIIFWIYIIINMIGWRFWSNEIVTSSLFSSFTSVFLLTLSSPMTIVFFTSLFATKAIEYGYKKKELFVFGFSTGLATLLFMWTAVIFFSLIKNAVPILLIQILNWIVGCLLMLYWWIRLKKLLYV